MDGLVSWRRWLSRQERRAQWRLCTGMVAAAGARARERAVLDGSIAAAGAESAPGEGLGQSGLGLCLKSRLRIIGGRLAGL